MTRPQTYIDNSQGQVRNICAPCVEWGIILYRSQTFSWRGELKFETKLN